MFSEIKEEPANIQKPFNSYENVSLPKLEEDPVDTRFVVTNYGNTPHISKHLTIHFFVYISIGLLFFSSVMIIGFAYLFSPYKNEYINLIRKNPKDLIVILPALFTGVPVAPNPIKISLNSYTNFKQHYSITYPSNWHVVEDAEYTVILYPPGSLEYIRLTQDDIGAGRGPEIDITIINRPLAQTIDKNTVFTTTSGVQGYQYIENAKVSPIPTIDLPLRNNSQIAEFTLQTIGQHNLDTHLADHKAPFTVKDIDAATYEKIVKSFQLD